MNSLLHISYRYPRTLLAILFLITIVMGLGIRKLEVRNSFAGELPAEDPINQGIEAAQTYFGERSAVLVGISSPSVYTRETAEKIIGLTAALSELPYVLPDEIVSMATVRNISQRDWGLETGILFEPFPQTPQEWDQIAQDIAENAMVYGRLVSHDGTLAVIVAPLEEGFEGGKVYEEALRLVAAFQGPEKIYVSGAPVLVEDVQRGISGDSRKFIPIAIVLIFIGFYLCFRQLAGVLLPVGMVVMSIVWTMGFMGYTGLEVTVVSNALPVIMVAVASSYGIHFMNTYYHLAGQGLSKQALAAATLHKIGKPILITGVTSALGSASLLIFRIVSLQEFGIIGAAGFLFATLICLTFLPAACALLKPPVSMAQDEAWIVGMLKHITLTARKNRRQLVAGYAVVLTLCILFIGKIQIGDDYIRFFPISHPGRQAAEAFNERLNGVRIMDIVVDATPYGGIKNSEFFSQLSAFQTLLETLPEVGSTYSYCNIVDHLGQQFGQENEEGIDETAIAQYLMLHEMSATPGEVFSLFTEDEQFAKIQVFLKSSDPEVHQVLYEQIQQEAVQFFGSAPGVLTFGGDVMHRIALGTYIVKGKIQNIVLALAIVGLCCLVIFRSWQKSMFTLLPIFFSLIMVFGTMGIIGIRLGISTSLLTAMIVGIGIDFAVHYLVSYYQARRQQSPEKALLVTSTLTGRAIAYDAVSNIVGFSVLSFSGFLPVQHFGWLLAFSMLLIFFNTLLIYPMLLATSPQKILTTQHS